MARILVVEDEQATLRVMRLFLAHLGHEVKAAASVQEAHAAAREGAFDALLADWRLPDGTAEDVLAALPPTPAIVISGFCQDSDRKRSLKSGFSDHLAKPINLDQLQMAVDQLLTNPAF